MDSVSDVSANKNNESASPSNLLDHLLKQYENDIKAEFRLINEVYYTINKSYSLSTGLSPARGFLPVVKISSKHNNKKCITCTHFEWNTLINYRNQIDHHFNNSNCTSKRTKTNESDGKYITTYYVIDDTLKIMCDYQVNKKYEYQPIVSIERYGVTINFKKSAASMFWKLLNIINYRLKKLIDMNIASCYEILLSDIVQNKENTVSVEEYAMKTLEDAVAKWGQVHKWSEEHNIIFMEILLFESDKIKTNVGTLVINNLI